MTTAEIITSDLKTVVRRLKLSRILDALPERLTLAYCFMLARNERTGPHVAFPLWLMVESTALEPAASGVTGLEGPSLREPSCRFVGLSCTRKALRCPAGTQCFRNSCTNLHKTSERAVARSSVANRRNTSRK